jgi:hypothetical protein
MTAANDCEERLHTINLYLGGLSTWGRGAYIHMQDYHNIRLILVIIELSFFGGTSGI